MKACLRVISDVEKVLDLIVGSDGGEPGESGLVVLEEMSVGSGLMPRRGFLDVLAEC